MRKWLKTNVYLAAWLGAVAGVVGAAAAVVAVNPPIERIAKHVRATLCVVAAAGILTLYPKLKRAAKGVLITFLAWVMVTSAFMFMRMTMSKEVIKEVTTTLVIVGILCLLIQASQNGLKEKTEA